MSVYTNQEWIITNENPQDSIADRRSYVYMRWCSFSSHPQEDIVLRPLEKP